MDSAAFDPRHDIPNSECDARGLYIIEMNERQGVALVGVLYWSCNSIS